MENNIIRSFCSRKNSILIVSLIIALLHMPADQDIKAQSDPDDLARYTPEWIRDGFANTGTTHEPWIFLVRRGGRIPMTKEEFEYRLSEPYIRNLAESGITVYHMGGYKGFGFEIEKEYMDKLAEAAAIAHSYGMKVDTYVQWNTMAYETFFAEVPEAKEDVWYQIDVNGKPIMLTYGYQQSFRYRPCFNHDDYMDWFKEKVLRYLVEVVKTDFIHFDNFDLNPPPDACFNPATIKAFRNYLADKYSPEERLERFGFEDVSFMLPPKWNDQNPAHRMTEIRDPVIQEWIDFRCWTMTTRLAECARFVRELNKEVVIEVNPHGLVGNNRAWERGINHPDLMQYTNVIWTEDGNYPRWENGIAIGKFRHFKLGRTTNNFIMTYNRTAQDNAENLALNRTIAYGGISGESGKYLNFWHKNRDLYTNVNGGEKVAVLRSYPSMAYNTTDTHISVNMAEQALQQRQIPFDIIFDQQLGHIAKYQVIVLANQESLTDEAINTLKRYVKDGGGIVMTCDTGRFDGWRRPRMVSMLDEMLQETGLTISGGRGNYDRPVSFEYGKGRVIYLPRLTRPREEIAIGYTTNWEMPENANELESAVLWASNKKLPLRVTAPEWIGVSHDTQKNRDIIHLFNYRDDCQAAGITLQYDGHVKDVWAISPDKEKKQVIPFTLHGDTTELRIPEFDVYLIIVLERS